MVVAATLVERLRASDALGLPDAEKKGVVESIVAGYGDNPLIAEVLRGGVSISDAVTQLHERYRGWRLWLPVFRGKEYEQRLEAAGVSRLLRSETLAPPSKSNNATVWIYDKLMNPVVGTLLAGGLVGLLSYISGGGEVEEAVVGAALAGVFIGLTTYAMRKIDSNNIVSDSRYLDTKISQLRNA